jgi:homogentisate 1,2-dioxygenase
LYRIRPAAVHGVFEPFEQPQLAGRFDTPPASPEQMRWSPMRAGAALRFRRKPVHAGRQRLAGRTLRRGGAPVCGRARHAGRFFYDADGELLIVPQQGRLRLDTELGGSTSSPGRSR